MRHFPSRIGSGRLALGLTGVALGLASGCGNPGARARLTQENMTLREANARLERTVGQLGAEIAALRRQVENLKGFGPNAPADLFAPVRVDIVSLSGGVDLDGQPGDDGVVVYVRPRDADGHAVKAPGRIRIQITDNTTIGSPRVLGVYVFDRPEDLRRSWHSRFGTMHYALTCPFMPDARPRGPRVTVNVEFTDFLTGRTLTAVKELPVKPAPGNDGGFKSP